MSPVVMLLEVDVNLEVFWLELGTMVSPLNFTEKNIEKPENQKYAG